MTEAGLEVHGLSVSYGGRRAVHDVSISASAGQITGLVGPNGAGKTTTFNAVSGLVQPSAGSIHLFGEDITRMPPASRARLGLGRTFQRMELVNSMTTRSNVALGAECRQVGSNPIKQVFSTIRQRREVIAAADLSMNICGIDHLAERMVGTLSTGQRRLVELARTLAGDFKILLLDEPSSGLDDKETARFGEILKEIVAGGDVGILLVEHDMDLVMTICDRIFVLDFGKLIFEGTAAETKGSPLVKAAYLGSEEVQEAV